MLNSLSAYHSGQGGGATCFISFPEYSVPAKAAEPTRAVPSRHNSSFFIYFSFLVKSLQTSLVHSQGLSRHVWMPRVGDDQPKVASFFGSFRRPQGFSPAPVLASVITNSS